MINLKKIVKASNKGQFFYPDLVAASALFLVTLTLFLVVSTSVSNEIQNFEYTKAIDEASHSSINALLYTSGQPSNWEFGSISDVNYFGLVYSKNFLEKQKVLAFANFLNTDYNLTKQKLLSGEFDFKFRILDYNDSVIVEAGRQASSRIFVYERIAFYDSKQVKIQAVFSSND